MDYQWFRLKIIVMIYELFSLKTTGTVSPGLASKPMATSFSVWASKPAAIFW
jgi:hypothetical protein